jgi:hypothetical protein
VLKLAYENLIHQRSRPGIKEFNDAGATIAVRSDSDLGATVNPFPAIHNGTTGTAHRNSLAHAGYAHGARLNRRMKAFARARAVGRRLRTASGHNNSFAAGEEKRGQHSGQREGQNSSFHSILKLRTSQKEYIHTEGCRRNNIEAMQSDGTATTQ